MLVKYIIFKKHIKPIVDVLFALLNSLKNQLKIVSSLLKNFC